MKTAELKLLEVTLADNPDLARLIREVFDEHGAPKLGTVYTDPTTDDLYSLFRRKRSVLWVAHSRRGIEGCCGIFPTDGLADGVAELVKFYVSKESRGQGVGKLLMQKSIQSATEHGYSHLYLESLPHFSKAVSMYEKLGFRRLPHALGNSGHKTCDIWMIKELH